MANLAFSKNSFKNTIMGESSKFPKSCTLENQNLKLALRLQNTKNSKFNGQIPFDKQKLNLKCYHYLQNSAF